MSAAVEAMLEQLAARVRQLEDREAIRTLVNRYAWYAALSDADELGRLFTRDGVLDQADRAKTGRAEIVAYFRTLPAGYIAPVVSNFIIEFDSTDRARATCKMITSHVGSQSGITGWYEDVYERIGSEWLIARRRWTTQKPLAQGA